MDWTWFIKGSNWQMSRRNKWFKIEKLGFPHRIKSEDLDSYPLLKILELLRIAIHPSEALIRGINRNELLTYLDKQGDNILKALNADENTIFRNLHTGHLTSIEKEKLGIFNVQNLSTFFENYEPHRGFNLPLFNRYKQHLEQAQEIVKDNPNESYLEDSAFSDSVFSELRLRYKKVKVKKYIKMVEYKIDLILNEAPESLRKDYYKKVDTEDLFRFFEVAS